jgi:uncharacterized caspase-like protein
MAALVIGNSNYPDDHDLKNPTNDATDLGAQLKSYGFDVSVALNCTLKEMDRHLKAFRKLLETYEVALFFFAGHGMNVNVLSTEDYKSFDRQISAPQRTSVSRPLVFR